MSPLFEWHIPSWPAKLRGVNFLQSVRSRCAFSLIETAMAIGIVAFALAGLAGLMPVALDSIGTARNAVIISELAEAHLSQAARSDFSALPALAGSWWYDEAGKAVRQGAPGAYYEVINRPRVLDPDTMQFQVVIYRYRPGESAPAPDKFVILVANNGR